MSGAATMRNAVKRITHKERSQPKSREKFGLLEKHKDYKERSYDHHKKRDLLKVLSKKARDRNPDEFYMKMNSAQVKGGKHRDIKKDTAIGTDEVKLMKSQDMGYLLHKKGIDDRKAEKLKKNLHLIGDTKPKLHKVFVNSKDELDTFNDSAHFETAPGLMDRSYNRIKTNTIKQAVERESVRDDYITSGGGNSYRKKRGRNDDLPILPLPTGKELRKALHTKEKSYSELLEREKRSKKLGGLARKLQLQRNLMGKGSKKKIIIEGEQDNDGEDKVIYKWKKQRQK